MKKIGLIILLLSIIILLIFGYRSFNKNKSTDSTKNNIVFQNEIVIKTDPVLESDIKTRLEPLIKDSVVPIKIDNVSESADMAIYLDDNNSQNENDLVIYKKEITLAPSVIKDAFLDKTTPLTIKLKSKNSSQISGQIKEFLKQSYENNPPAKNKLIFAGDILLSRWVAKRSNDHNDPLYCFRETAEITRDADLTIANLEAPFAETGPYTNMGIVFRADPKLAEGLTFAGFDVLNLANNHFGDSGREGMGFTFQTLNDRKINYYGTGENQAESRKPLIKEINGIKYAFLGYTDPAFSPVSSEASEDYAGINLMNIDDLKDDLKKAHEQADFVIVTMNSGVEYTYDPNQTQIDFARAAINERADMIFGLHPHVVQAIEFREGKPIFYNVGNYIMDQLDRNTQQGYIIKMSTIFSKIVSIELLPYHIYDYCQPKIVGNTEVEEILNNILEASKKLE